jgi:hypothetical protein
MVLCLLAGHRLGIDFLCAAHGIKFDYRPFQCWRNHSHCKLVTVFLYVNMSCGLLSKILDSGNMSALVIVCTRLIPSDSKAPMWLVFPLIFMKSFVHTSLKISWIYSASYYSRNCSALRLSCYSVSMHKPTGFQCAYSMFSEASWLLIDVWIYWLLLASSGLLQCSGKVMYTSCFSWFSTFSRLGALIYAPWAKYWHKLSFISYCL